MQMMGNYGVTQNQVTFKEMQDVEKKEIEQKAKQGVQVVEGRSINKYDWPIVLIYALIFLALIASSILICICLCDKDAAKDELGDE